MNKGIDWAQVKARETEIEGKGAPTRWCILGIDDNQVWVKRVNRQYPESVYQIFSKQFIGETYNIYDPWEEITEECVFDDWGHVSYKGQRLTDVQLNTDKFKYGPGLRVWKRKEGS